MALKQKAVARLSGGLTLATGLGFVAAVSLTPGPALLATSAAGPAATMIESAAASNGSAASSDAPSPLASTNIELVRTRALPAAELGLAASQTEPAGAALAASRRNSAAPTAGAGVPETTWDGTPQSGTRAAPEVSPATGAAAVPAANAEPFAAKPVESRAAAAPPTPVSAPVAETWTAEEVAAALKDCLKLLGPVAAEIEPIEPVKKGSCGAAAPVRLKSIGAGERIQFTPPIEINCRLAVGLAEWAERSLQPAALSALGSRVVRVSGASGYQCRNRYGLPNAPLSEHALANAVDIPGFVLANGRSVRIKSGWGPTARDLLAKSQATSPGGDKPAGADAAEIPAKSGKASPPPDKDRKAKSADPGTRVATPAALKGIPLQKLGAGATSVSAKAAADPARQDADAMFLRQIFKGACDVFGTVLGPEANEAHRDHFHLDMKARKRTAFCE